MLFSRQVSKHLVLRGWLKCCNTGDNFFSCIQRKTCLVIANRTRDSKSLQGTCVCFDKTPCSCQQTDDISSMGRLSFKLWIQFFWAITAAGQHVLAFKEDGKQRGERQWRFFYKVVGISQCCSVNDGLHIQTM